MRIPTAPLVRCTLVLGLLLGPAACGEPTDSKVTIMVPWSGAEFQAFYAVVQAFERSHPGIDVEPQVTRALTQQLDAAVAADAEPDLAVLPSVGAIAKYQQEGALRKLDVDTADYAQPFRGLGMHRTNHTTKDAKDGQGTKETTETQGSQGSQKGDGGGDGESTDDVYAIPVKADVKSLVWYDATATPKPPADWAALRSRHYTWCLGLESGPTSGWPGADWIADLLLAEKGVQAYTAWASGNAHWDKGPVHGAWTMWGDLVAGARGDAAKTGFRAAVKNMPACSLSHGTLSAMGFDAAQVKKRRYLYVSPPGNTLQVSADFVGKFTGNASADEFIAYLASTPAQRMWVNRPGFALSADRQVAVEDYDDAVQGEIAGMLHTSAYTLCFSAADAMDPDVSAAFYRAVLEYADGAAEGPLLKALDKVQAALGSARSTSPPLCGTP
ncbi:ABC transporter substrate-binding protein [Streptomyces humidus]|uniref:ABC transporter substrate-binding protein n=1 Tax=Streptomyces humidus TaxID=52259 RepID=A0A918FV92_9ACTN|nr:ABC transporter substrate-binding protein [Streptomyces humidus]GGR89438.1 ABC transporter substrate-binding protein [Streptomyces humidus]